MKITFVVPTLNLTGGIRVVSVYAELLAKKGNTVTVVSPNKKKPTIKARIKAILSLGGSGAKSGYDASFFNNRSYSVKLLDTHRAVESSDVPDADIIIVTFWNTAEWVSVFPSTKGKKVYFIQHYEVHPWLPIERVKATYKLPYKQIVVSQWIADILSDKYGLENISVVGNGVEEQQFFSGNREKNKIFTVGLMYAGQYGFKDCETIFASIHEARKTIPDLKVVSFSTKEPTEAFPLPESSEFYLRPKQNEIRTIYDQCDAWLFGSRSEGFGLPILEAMACGTPVIGTKAGAAPELLKNGEGVLIDIGDVSAMSEAIIDMAMMSSSDWKEMSDKALLRAKENPWSIKVNEFERELLCVTNDRDNS